MTDMTDKDRIKRLEDILEAIAPYIPVSISTYADGSWSVWHEDHCVAEYDPTTNRGYGGDS